MALLWTLNINGVNVSDIKIKYGDEFYDLVHSDVARAMAGRFDIAKNKQGALLTYKTKIDNFLIRTKLN